MRAEILYPLFAPLENLKGVGDAVAGKLAKLCGARIFDLLCIRPQTIIDRRYSPPILSAEPGKVASFEVTIDRHDAPRRFGLPYVVTCSNDTGFLELVFFHYKGDYLRKKLVHGAKFIVSGRIEMNGEKRQMPHPDYMLPIADKAKIMRIEPQYPLTSGISQNKIQDLMTQALQRIPNLPEWQKAAKVTWKDALTQLHNPQSEADLQPTNSAILRLAYDELLAHQLTQAISYQKNKDQSSVIISGTSKLQKQLTSELPFSLTGGQIQALDEINTDLASGQKMMRLLQGDVGSGKTIVALLTMLPLIEKGYQCAFMMPTTLLATQQVKAIQKFLGQHELRVELLTSNEKGKKREQIYADLAAGKIDILVGTHALFQDTVNIKNLGLAIIDEQHRFGVEQRLRLTQKSPHAHVLLMTATPIPRTLTMAFFGDMDVSRITEKPANRKPITTVAMPLARIDQLYESIKRALSNGEKIYWICPLVEDSDKVNLANVTARFKHLQEHFGDDVGLVHGRMKEAEKDEVLGKFLRSELKILVATTVIEVGIDVPDATVIIIENSDNFGLSQLHQLRGRVGRGDKASTCILLYDGKPGANGQARLKILKNSEDGFEIAEEDLNLRGSGEVLGTRQSGEIEFHFADLAYHKNLVIDARHDARAILQNDPKFESPRGKNLQLLLQLFNFEDSLRYTQG